MNPSKVIHLIGVGGIGMSGIAEILLRSGYRVFGSDLRANAETEAQNPGSDDLSRTSGGERL